MGSRESFCISSGFGFRLSFGFSSGFGFSRYLIKRSSCFRRLWIGESYYITLANIEFGALTDDPSALERFSVEKSVGASPMPFAVLKIQESSIASLPTVSFFAHLQRFAPQRLQRVPAAQLQGNSHAAAYEKLGGGTLSARHLFTQSICSRKVVPAKCPHLSLSPHEDTKSTSGPWTTSSTVSS